MTIEQIRNSTKPVYLVLLIDGREYQAEVRGKNRKVPFVSYETSEGFFRQEYTWQCIERGVNGEVIHG